MARSISIKPHHFVDIVTSIGGGQTEFAPHAYGHALHTVAEAILRDPDIAVRMELGADDICARCRLVFVCRRDVRRRDGVGRQARVRLWNWTERTFRSNICVKSLSREDDSRFYGGIGRMNRTPRNTREHIILELKQSGSLTTRELAARIGITATAVRQVLNALQAEGLVDSRAVKQPQGRPSYVHSLTAKGHDLFPGAYDTLAMELLESVRELGGEEMVRGLMARQLAKKEERYRVLMEGRSILEKLARLRHLRDNDGYMAEVVEQDEKTLALLEHNCPIQRIAEEHPEMCAHELALMERLLGADLNRTLHILAGDHCCCFEVAGTPSSDDPAPETSAPDEAGSDRSLRRPPDL